MTLCLAWRDGPWLALASDSRLTFRAEDAKRPALTVDAGVKLSRITCLIFEPEEPGEMSPARRQSLEIACLFSGSSVTAYALRDHLNAALQRLYHIPTEPLKADAIFELIEHVFRKIVQLYREKLEIGAKVKVFLAMGCPSDGSLRSLAIEWAGEFSPRITRDPLNETDPYLFGDEEAVMTAKKLIAGGTRPLNALDTIITEKKCATVGGGIQLGRLSRERLTFMSIHRNVYIQDSNDKEDLVVVQSWGSLDLNALNGELQTDAIRLGYPATELPDIRIRK